KGREGVELERGGVPAEKALPGASLEGEGKHVLLVVDVDFDLVLVLRVGDRETRPHLDFGSVFRAHSHEGSDDALRLSVASIAAYGMIKDRKDDLRLNVDGDG